MQSPTIYHQTLGKISHNYQLVEKDGHWNIEEVKKPFISITHENILQWDGRIYHCIKERGYDSTPGCYHNVRGAFFPLFPWVWKGLGNQHWLVCLLNYFVFAISILFLIQWKTPDLNHNKPVFYILFLTLPSSIIFFLPYTESLFFIFTIIALFGIQNGKEKWYFFGAFLLALTRAASIFVLLGFLLTEVVLLWKGQDLKSFLKACIKRAAPFLIAYFFVWLVQFFQSGSMMHFFEAHALWPKPSGWPQKISDWSKEGFGLNIYSLLFVGLFATLYLLFTIWYARKEWIKRHYVLMTSLFYIGGIMLFKVCSGGNLHSTFRFIMATPFFYILAMHLLGKRKNIYQTFVWFGGGIIILILALTLIKYGHPRFSFSYAGLYLSLIWTGTLAFSALLCDKIKYILVTFLWFANAIWISYLFNGYISEGWIFT
jgi:hypothetical protein